MDALIQILIVSRTKNDRESEAFNANSPITSFEFESRNMPFIFGEYRNFSKKSHAIADISEKTIPTGGETL